MTVVPLSQLQTYVDDFDGLTPQFVRVPMSDSDVADANQQIIDMLDHNGLLYCDVIDFAKIGLDADAKPCGKVRRITLSKAFYDFLRRYDLSCIPSFGTVLGVNWPMYMASDDFKLFGRMHQVIPVVYSRWSDSDRLQFKVFVDRRMCELFVFAGMHRVDTSAASCIMRILSGMYVGSRGQCLGAMDVMHSAFHCEMKCLDAFVGDVSEISRFRTYIDSVTQDAFERMDLSGVHGEPSRRFVSLVMLAHLALIRGFFDMIAKRAQWTNYDVLPELVDFDEVNAAGTDEK